MRCPLCRGRLAYKADLPQKTQRVFECKSCGRWFALFQKTKILNFIGEPKPWSVS